MHWPSIGGAFRGEDDDDDARRASSKPLSADASSFFSASATPHVSLHASRCDFAKTQRHLVVASSSSPSSVVVQRDSTNPVIRALQSNKRRQEKARAKDSERLREARLKRQRERQRVASAATLAKIAPLLAEKKSSEKGSKRARESERNETTPEGDRRGAAAETNPFARRPKRKNQRHRR